MPQKLRDLLLDQGHDKALLGIIYPDWLIMLLHPAPAPFPAVEILRMLFASDGYRRDPSDQELFRNRLFRFLIQTRVAKSHVFAAMSENLKLVPELGIGLFHRRGGKEEYPFRPRAIFGEQLRFAFGFRMAHG